MNAHNNAIARFTDIGILKGGNSRKKDPEIQIVDFKKANDYSGKIKGYLELIG